MIVLLFLLLLLRLDVKLGQFSIYCRSQHAFRGSERLGAS